ESLGVIEAIDAQQQSAVAHVLFNRGEFLLNGRRDRQLSERFRVNAHRKDAKPYLALMEPHAVFLRLDPRQVSERSGEMLHVRIGMEADQIGAKQPLEDLSTPGEDAENLIGWER